MAGNEIRVLVALLHLILEYKLDRNNPDYLSAGLAHLDRVARFERVGRGFESLILRHLN